MGNAFDDGDDDDDGNNGVDEECSWGLLKWIDDDGNDKEEEIDEMGGLESWLEDFIFKEGRGGGDSGWKENLVLSTFSKSISWL